MIGQFIGENVEKAKFLTASVTITLKNIKVTKNSEPVNNKTRYEVRHRPAEGTVTHCFDYSISVAAVFFSRASCKFVQGRRKLPQSGWARQKIIPLVVKSGWAHVPFQ